MEDSPWTASPLFSLPDESSVPMSYVRDQILGPLEEQSYELAEIHATATYWAGVIMGYFPLPLATGGVPYHRPDTKNPQPTKEMDLKRFKAGQRGLNRVTAYQRPDSPYWYIEWFEDGQRRALNMRHYHGAPVESAEIAKAVAHNVAAQIKSERVMAMFEEVVRNRPEMAAAPFLRETQRMSAPGPMPGLEHAEHPANPNSAKGPLPEGIAEPGRDKTYGDLADAYLKAKQNELRESSLRAYRTGYNSFAEVIPYDTPLHLITREKAADAMKYLSEGRKKATKGKRVNLDDSTMKTRSTHFKTLFTWANGAGWTTRDFLFDMSAHKSDHVHREVKGRCYTDEEFQALLEIAPEKDWIIAFFFWWSWDSGQRIVCQTLLEGHWMEFRTREDGTEVCLITVPAGADKNKEEYTAILKTPEAVALAHRAAEECEANGGPLFPVTASDSWTERRTKDENLANRLRKRLRKVEKAAGVESVHRRSFHGSKSQFATRYFRAGELAYAARVSNTDEATLMKWYARLNGEIDIEALPAA